jgi:hypothetical protein
MAVVDFPHSLYGLPIAAGYTIDTDSALSRAALVSGHVRQRRTYMHQASLVKLTFRMSIEKAASFVIWARENIGNWWVMSLLSGNEDIVGCPITQSRVRLLGTIKCGRIPLTPNLQVSFEVETHDMGGWEPLSAAKVAAEWPTSLPLPMASSFSSVHGPRGQVTYGLSWKLTTKQLREFVKFASYSGVGWFSMPMISARTPCGTELVRFTTGISQNLVGPDLWEVTTQAETLMDYAHTSPALPGASSIKYSAPGATYDDPTVVFNGF